MLTVEIKSLRLEPGARVLDLGCGTGRHLHGLFYEGVDALLVGADLSAEDLQTAGEGFAAFPEAQADGPPWVLTVGDALRLPFEDNSFDTIICSEVLEHIPDYQGALAEITRILKPGGRLAVSVPRYWPEWICWKFSEGYHNTPGGHVRIFQDQVLRRDIVAHGFKFRRRHWAHGLHSPYWWLQCAMWESRDTNWLIRQYHKFLVWDIMKRPLLTRVLAAIADPLMGKSVVLYFDKQGTA